MGYKPKKPTLIGLVLLSFLSIGAFTFSSLFPAQAADNNFADGITVDSKGDGGDANLADSICDDGSGNCTLRAAIEESNQEAGTQTIEFNITGPADFTNGGQNGFTIQPQSALPNITDTVVIDGYTQPGSQANTAVAPNPLNGILLIELDGTTIYGLGASGIRIKAGAVELYGLIINNMGSSGISVEDGDNPVIAGNYVGTNYAGNSAKANYGNGISVWPLAPGDNSSSGIIGGVDPEDRNIISGNGIEPSSSGIGLGTNSNNWQIKGNYIGVAVDGVTAIPNAQPGGAGSPSIDYNSGTIVGGDEVGATNVISGNLGHGIAPHESHDTSIIGNFIGTDYTGAISIPNGSGGVAFSDSNNSTIRNNIISSSGYDGIYVQNGDSFAITGNTIGSGINKTELFGNTQSAIAIENSVGVIGGSQLADSNFIAFNTQCGVNIYNNSVVELQGNTVSQNAQCGVRVLDNSSATIGGSGANEGNTIENNSQQGIIVNANSYITVLGNDIISNGFDGISLTDSSALIGGTGTGDSNTIDGNGENGIELQGASQASILRNSIAGNTNLGIDLDANSNPEINDLLDSDTGSNDLLNYPEYTSVVESGGDTTVAYRLDVPAGDYRVEFFSNSSPDASGYGEGETYLGFANITHPGGGVDYFTHTLTGVTGATNLAMTTTERNVATPSGFGSTSEFSANTASVPSGDLSLTKTLVNPEDVAIGATLTYQFTITNEGPESVDLSIYDGSSLGVNNLITDIMSADITYLGNASSPNIACGGPGPGSAGIFGPALANHSDHEIVACSWIGPSQLLTVGSSFSFSFDVVVQPGSDLIFNNYAVLLPTPAQDPDAAALGAIFTSGQDILDLLTTSGINNFSYAPYPVPVVPEPDPTPTNPNANKGTNNSLLAKTGEAILSWYGLVGLLVSTGGLLVWRRRNKNSI